MSSTEVDTTGLVEESSLNLEANIENLDDLTRHIQSRAGEFLSTASNLFPNNWGWQRVRRRYDRGGRIQKRHLDEYDDRTNALFTGYQLCDTLAETLESAIDSIVDSRGLEFEVSTVLIMTAYDAENWEIPLVTWEARMPHRVVKVTDISNNQTKYYDPTYAQIDHKYAEQILVLSDEESITSKYGSVNGNLEKVPPEIRVDSNPPYAYDEFELKIQRQLAQIIMNRTLAGPVLNFL
jgi:hypothetical protein